MTEQQRSVRDWMVAFGQEAPEKPCVPSLEVRKLRAKLILEEALETCHALNMHPYLKRNHYEDDMIEEGSIGFWEDKDQEIKLTEIADGCEDLKVVTEGTLVACGLIDNNRTFINYNPPSSSFVDPLFDEVMRSNWSKMWTEEEVQGFEIDLIPFKKTGNPFPLNGSDKQGRTCLEVMPNKWLVKDKDGKVIKSPSYSPANLQPIIDELAR